MHRRASDQVVGRVAALLVRPPHATRQLQDRNGLRTRLAKEGVGLDVNLMRAGEQSCREMVRGIAEHQHALVYLTVLIETAAREVERPGELGICPQFLSDVLSIEVVICSYRRRGET